MMSILSPSSLETLDYRSILWETILNKNFSIIDWRLQKIERLLDADTPAATRRNESILMWSGSKWVAAKVQR